MSRIRQVKVDVFSKLISLILTCTLCLWAGGAQAQAQTAPERDAIDGQAARDSNDFPRALELLTRGCDAGSANACASLAGMHNNGQGLAIDTSKAWELAENACQRGSQRGCGLVAVHLMEGTGRPKIQSERQRN